MAHHDALHVVRILRATRCPGCHCFWHEETEACTHGFPLNDQDYGGLRESSGTDDRYAEHGRCRTLTGKQDEPQLSSFCARGVPIRISLQAVIGTRDKFDDSAELRIDPAAIAAVAAIMALGT